MSNQTQVLLTRIKRTDSGVLRCNLQLMEVALRLATEQVHLVATETRPAAES